MKDSTWGKLDFKKGLQVTVIINREQIWKEASDLSRGPGYYIGTYIFLRTNQEPKDFFELSTFLLSINQ